jgi:hypothetical protein
VVLVRHDVALAEAVSRAFPTPSGGARHAMARLGLACTFAVALLMLAWQLSPLVDADWAILDDHEIIQWIGTRDRLPASEIVPRLRETEVWDPSHMRRFRPSYYVLRLTETATWGRQVGAWYAARAAIAVFVALVLAWFCHRAGGAVLASSFLVYELSRRYWNDLFAQLGPAETYGALGIAMVALGADRIVRRRGTSGWPAALVLAGGVIAMGSKESLLPLALVPAGLLAWRWRELSVAARVMCAACIAFAVGVAVTVATMLASSGRDVYERSVSVGTRLELLGGLAQARELQVLALLFGLVLLVLATPRVAAPADAEASRAAAALRASAWAVLATMGLFVTQYVFYNGQWPAPEPARYHVPGLVAVHLTVFGVACALLRTLRAGAAPTMLPALGTGLAAAAMVLAAVPDLPVNRAVAERSVENARRFAAVREAATIFLRSNPQAPLLITSHHPDDYEPAYSIIRFTRAAGLANPIAVDVRGSGSATYPAGSLQRRVVGELEALARQGGTQYGLTPIDAMPEGPACLIISLSGPPSARCSHGMTAWPQLR